MPRLYIFISGVFLLFIFLFFSYTVHKDFFIQLDFDTTVRLQDNLSRRFDNIFSIFSDIGKFEVMVIVLVMIFAVSRKFIAGLVSLVFFAGFHIIELFGKYYVNHPPPPQFMLRTKSIIDFPQFHVRADNSYPSGHSGRTIFISVILLLFIWQTKKMNIYLKIFLTLCIIIFDVVMLVSRPYLGEHWLSDVIGGGLLGAGLALAGIAYFLDRDKVKKVIKKA